MQTLLKKLVLAKKSILPLGGVILVLVAVIVIAGCRAKESQEVTEPVVYKPVVETITVAGGLTQPFSVTGEVFANKLSTVTAEQRGEIQSIRVEVGDTVRTGQVLLGLRSSTVTSQYNSSRTALSNAQTSLERTQTSSEKAIEAAEIALETARTNLSNTLKQNETLLKQAEETLNSASVSVDLSVQSAESALQNQIQDAFPAAQVAANAADKLLGVSPTYEFSDDAFENNLGALDSLGRLDTERNLERLLEQLTIYQATYDNAHTLLKNAELVMQQTLTVIKSSLIGSNYTQASLDADYASINAQLSAVRASITKLEAAKRALESAKQETNGGSQSVLSAQAAYQNTLRQLQSNEDSARRAVEQAENQLESAKNNAELNVNSAKTAVDNTYGQYDQARINQGKLTVDAPFAGEIMDVLVKEGQEVNPGTALLTIQDDSQLKIVTYLSPDDVERVSVGDKVFLSNGESSTIASIAPGADPSTKKYKVEVIHKSESLNPGEFLKLTFMSASDEGDDRIFIPLNSLHILPNENYVWTLQDGKTAKTVVEIGDIVGNLIQVTSGIKPDDVVITEGGRLIEEEGIEVKINQ